MSQQLAAASEGPWCLQSVVKHKAHVSFLVEQVGQMEEAAQMAVTSAEGNSVEEAKATVVTARAVVGTAQAVVGTARAAVATVTEGSEGPRPAAQAAEAMEAVAVMDAEAVVMARVAAERVEAVGL